MEDSHEGTKTLIKIQLLLDVRSMVSLYSTILRVFLNVKCQGQNEYSPFVVINTHYNKYYKDSVRDLL